MKGYYNVFPSHIYSLDPYLHFININILILISHLEENRKHKTVRQHKWVEKACDKQLTAFVAVWNMLNMTWNKKKKKFKAASEVPHLSIVFGRHTSVCVYIVTKANKWRGYIWTHISDVKLWYGHSQLKRLCLNHRLLWSLHCSLSAYKKVFFIF